MHKTSAIRAFEDLEEFYYSKLMGLKQLRNFIFWTLVLLYLITMPIICLQALGFVFETKTMSFVKTGIISIDSEPKEVNVSINKILHSKKTPVAISRLRAGRYEIDVEAWGYQSWRHSLDVRPEEVTRVEHILLVPTEIKATTPFSFPVQAVIPSRDERFLFLISQSDKSTSIYAFDMKKERLILLVNHTEPTDNRTTSLELTISSDDKRLLILFRGNLSHEYVVATISERAIPISLSKLLKQPLSNVRFHPRNSRELLYLQNGILNQLDLDEGTLRGGILKGLKSFDVAEDKIYYFTEDTQLFSANLEGKEVVDLLPDRGLRRRLFSQNMKDTHQMFLTSKGNAFWLSKTGTLLTNRLPYFMDENVSRATLFTNSEKLFYWKTNELWLVDLNIPEEKEQSLFERGPSKVLLWRSNWPIVSVQVMRDGNHGIVATEKEIALVEAEPSIFGNHFMISRHSLGDKVTFYLNEDLGKLYWTDLRGKEAILYQVELFRPFPSPFAFSFRKSYEPAEEVFL